MEKESPQGSQTLRAFLAVKLVSSDGKPFRVTGPEIVLDLLWNLQALTLRCVCRLSVILLRLSCRSAASSMFCRAAAQFGFAVWRSGFELRGHATKPERTEGATRTTTPPRPSS